MFSFTNLFSEDPCQEYNVLDETTRTSTPDEVDDTSYYCDHEDSQQKSPAWQGPGWYRFMEPGAYFRSLDLQLGFKSLYALPL